MLRNSRYLFCAIALFAAVFMCVNATYAAKGGNGGGGGKPGGEDPPTTDPPPVLYEIQYFDMPNFSRGDIFGVNNSGQAVGWFGFEPNEDGVYENHAFIFNPGTTQAIDLNLIVEGIPDGWVIRRASAINEVGDIAAYLFKTDASGASYQAAMIDMNASVPTLHIIPDNTFTSFSVATDMNDFGDIIVVFQRDAGPWEAYTYNFGFNGVPPLVQGVYGGGEMKINNAGQILGQLQDGTPYQLSLNGDYEEFSGLGMLDFHGLNDAGEFCGGAAVQVRKNRTTRKAYVMGSELETFDSEGRTALDLNNSSDFVTGTSLYHRTLDLLLNLNDLLDPSDADTLIWNEQGRENYTKRMSDRVTAGGFPMLFGNSNGSSSKCYVLIPVPEL